MKSRIWLALCCVAAVLTSCDEGPTATTTCETVSLPLHGAPAGPVIVKVGLEVQSTGIVPVVTATDPQGTDNLRDVVQSLSVFPDAKCAGAPITLRDDLAGSGIEETFGTAVDATANPSLYAAIAAASTWPVAIEFQDRDGNRTAGRVAAPVLR